GTLMAPASWIWGVSFSPDGRWIATAGTDKNVRIWDVETDQQIAAFPHESSVVRAVFSPDGRRLLTMTIGRTAQIWDVETRQPVAALSGHERPLKSVAFAPDGRSVVTASSDKTARIWPAFRMAQELVDESKRLVPRCLTREQRAAALLDPEPPLWCVEL